MVDERPVVLTDFAGRRLSAAALFRARLRAEVRVLKLRRDFVIGMRHHQAGASPGQ
jgi:hypothetical protein